MNNILDEVLIEIEKQKSFKKWPYIVWFSILVLGILFRVMHWPGGSILTITSSAILNAYSFSSFLKLRGKNVFINIISSISVIWIIFIVSEYFFNTKPLYSLYGLSIYGGVLITSFIFYKMLFYARKKTNSNNYWL